MKKQQLESIIRDMKKLWAQSLAQVDNTSGRRGISMQMEAVEEMCAKRIDPAIERLLADIGPEDVRAAVPPSSLVLPVVSDPREAAGGQNQRKAHRSARNLRVVA